MLNDVGSEEIENDQQQNVCSTSSTEKLEQPVIKYTTFDQTTGQLFKS